MQLNLIIFSLFISATVLFAGQPGRGGGQRPGFPPNGTNITGEFPGGRNFTGRPPPLNGTYDVRNFTGTPPPRNGTAGNGGRPGGRPNRQKRLAQSGANQRRVPGAPGNSSGTPPPRSTPVALGNVTLSPGSQNSLKPNNGTRPGGPGGHRG